MCYLCHPHPYGLTAPSELEICEECPYNSIPCLIGFGGIRNEEGITRLILPYPQKIPILPTFTKNLKSITYLELGYSIFAKN